jgi:hypothetical protein
MYVCVMNRSEKIEKLANRPTLGFYESIALHCTALHCTALYCIGAQLFPFMLLLIFLQIQESG